MVQVFNVSGKASGEMKLGKAFSAPIRQDLIERAVLAERSAMRMPYGTDPMAGLRTSAHYHGYRRYRYTMMNREMARLKRIHGRVGHLSFTARIAPQVRKGREAHPPKAEKVWKEKINEKEWKRALVSAIAASSAKVVEGLKLPLIIEDKLEGLKKTKEVVSLIAGLGLEKELERAAERNVRAGKGKVRGRKYREKKGLLFVVKSDKGIAKAARNLPGADVVIVDRMMVSDIMPGGQARVVIWSKSAAEEAGKI